MNDFNPVLAKLEYLRVLRDAAIAGAIAGAVGAALTLSIAAGLASAFEAAPAESLEIHGGPAA